jgi:hypothetical protein
MQALLPFMAPSTMELLSLALVNQGRNLRYAVMYRRSPTVIRGKALMHSAPMLVVMVAVDGTDLEAEIRAGTQLRRQNDGLAARRPEAFLFHLHAIGAHRQVGRETASHLVCG